MNKIQTRSVSLLVAITITIGLLPGLRVNAEVVKEGTCGEGVSWTLDDEGTLTISGTGAMSDYSIAEAPWNNYRSSIQEIVISDGVTSIGDYAFYYCSADSVSIPESVTSIGSYAFTWCENLNNVEKEWGKFINSIK